MGRRTGADKNYGRDILMVMDISNSMQEPDFALRGRRIDRLTAVKLVASDFIRKRTDDRIGLVLFGTRAYLQAPITYDKKSVEEILKPWTRAWPAIRPLSATRWGWR